MCSQMPIKKIKVVSLLQQIYMASTSGECKEVAMGMGCDPLLHCQLGGTEQSDQEEPPPWAQDTLPYRFMPLYIPCKSVG